MKAIGKMMISLILIFVLAIPVYAGEAINADTWAVSYLQNAQEKGIVPEGLLGKGKAPITRKEFTNMAVLVYEKLTGERAQPKGSSPFTDESSDEVVFAQEVGIISGATPTLFMPQKELTREQMALLITRTMKASHKELTAKENKPMFSDISGLSMPSQEAIMLLYNKGIVSGYNGKYNPKNFVTVQEAVTAFYRAYLIGSGEKLVEVSPPANPIGAPETKVGTKEADGTTREAKGSTQQKPVVSLGKKEISLGMTYEEVVQSWGTPDRVGLDSYDFKRITYLGEYENFVMIGFKEDKVCEIFTTSPNFSFMGITGKQGTGSMEGHGHLDKYRNRFVLSGSTDNGYLLLDNEGETIGLLVQEKDMTKNTKKFSKQFVEDTKMQVFDIVNAIRVRNGLPVLRLDDTTSIVAERHAMDMHKKNYFAYTNQAGKTPFQRMKDAGIRFAHAGEVIGKVDGDAIAICQDWMQNAGSKANILSRQFDKVGVGVYNNNYTMYVVLDLYD